jgi:hypothetical protein
MAEDPKNTQKEFPGCCEGMPFAEIMRKVMETKESVSPTFCADMMCRMKQMCCGGGEKRDEAAQKREGTPTSNP